MPAESSVGALGAGDLDAGQWLASVRRVVRMTIVRREGNETPVAGQLAGAAGGGPLARRLPSLVRRPNQNWAPGVPSERRDRDEEADEDERELPARAAVAAEDPTLIQPVSMRASANDRAGM